MSQATTMKNDRKLEETNKNLTQFKLKNIRNLVSGGAIFSVQFIKRTTGEVRNMTCRVGVKKHLRGGNKSYSETKSNLLTVFDMEAKDYRSIPVDTIQSLRINGQVFSTQL